MGDYNKERDIRKIGNRKSKPVNFFIFCEGKKTEPNYFQGFKDLIVKKYSKEATPLDIKIEIIGTGRNCSSLVEQAKRESNKIINKEKTVWCVFDRDSFPTDDFDNSISMAESNEFKVAWSNESFELWYLLHFEDITAPIHRTICMDKLKKKFRENNFGDYEKSADDHFKIMRKDEKQSLAVARAKKLSKENESLTPSRSNPMTKVYELVEELENLLT